MVLEKGKIIEYKRNGIWNRATIIGINEDKIMLNVFAIQPVNAWRDLSESNDICVSLFEIEEIIEMEKEMV